MEDLTGAKFNRLLVLYKHPERIKSRVYWWCKCDCGTIKKVEHNHLKSGETKSCGCAARDHARQLNFKSGKTTLFKSEYGCLNTMIKRCYDSNDPQFKNYGARGITVCARWLESNGNYIFYSRFLLTKVLGGVV